MQDRKGLIYVVDPYVCASDVSDHSYPSHLFNDFLQQSPEKTIKGSCNKPFLNCGSSE